MRGLTYFILAYLLLALQLGLSGYFNIGQLAPDLVLPAVVFVSINVKREKALIGALTLGLIHDLYSQRPFGIFTFSYALAALFLVGLQASAHRQNLLMHFTATLGAGLLTSGLLWLNDWAYPILHQIPLASRPSILETAGNATYTAIVGVLMLSVLARFRFLIGRNGLPNARGVGYLR